MAITLPIFAFASDSIHSGTDEYLRSIGFTNEELSSRVKTEDREPFLIAEGEKNIADPLGDVLSRWGTTSDISFSWADIESVQLHQDEEAHMWIFSIQLAETIPSKPEAKVNFLLYVDHDRTKENNDEKGVHEGVDQEYSIVWNNKDVWYVDFRWFNPDAKFWAINQDTKATFVFHERSLVVKIPFEEIGTDMLPRWRVAIAASNKESTQIDVAPTIGFPPPKGTTYPTSDFIVFPEKIENSNSKWQISRQMILIIVLIVIGIDVSLFVVFKRKTKKNDI